MLTALRSFAKTKAAWVVFGLLVIAMAVGVGISDPFSGVSGGGLIQAGERRFGEVDVNRLVDEKIQELREESGEFITVQQAAERGITQQAIGELRQRAAILAFADKLGVRASPTAVSNLVADSPRFRDALGRVNPEALLAFANEQGFRNVREFEADFRDAITVNYIVGAAFAGVQAPDILVKPYVNYFGERRVLAFGRLTSAAVTPPAPPTEEDLVAFYNERIAQFAVPELRRFSVLAYSADDYLDKVDVGADLVRSEYDRRIKEFSTPETREIIEFSSAERNDVQAVVDAAKSGQTLEAALAAVPGITTATRTVQPDAVADEQYRQVVFGVPVGETFGPAQIEGQWRGVHVRSVTPGTPTPFEAVQDGLRNEMAQREAVRRFDETEDLFYDLVGGGATLEDMASELGVPLIDLAPVDQRGISLKGGRSVLLARHADQVRRMFGFSTGDVSEIIEGDNERVLIRLEEIVPPTTIPFEDVREDLTGLYTSSKFQEAALAVANAMAEAVKGGQAFDAAATAAKIGVIRPPEMMRQTGGGMDAALLNGAFALAEGEVGVVTDSRGEPWVVQVDSILPVTPEAEAALLPEARQNVNESVTSDFENIFLRTVMLAANPKDNAGAIQRYLDRFKQTDQ